jgi:lipoate-protein ligase A
MKIHEVRHSCSFDPFENQAWEEFHFENLKCGESKLLIFRNDLSVVWGRFQNPWMECDLITLDHLKGFPVRRISGGGTIVQDRGNINFSFLTSQEKNNPLDLSKHSSTENLWFLIKIIKEVLEINKNSQLEFAVNDRNDILLKGFKISGSAYRQQGHRYLHHFTLLYDSQLELLKKLLHSPWKNHIFKSLGTSSRSSPVTNILKEIHDGFDTDTFVIKIMDKIKDEVQKVSDGINFYQDPISEILKERTLKFKSLDWIWGKTPEFHVKVNNLFFNKDINLNENKNYEISNLAYQFEEGRLKKIYFLT